LPVSLQLERDGVLSMSDLLAKMTCNPARLLDLDSGTLAIGAAADIAIFDPDTTWTVDRNALVSKGKNTPWHGKEMTGQVTRTLKSGRVVYAGVAVHG